MLSWLSRPRQSTRRHTAVPVHDLEIALAWAEECRWRGLGQKTAPRRRPLELSGVVLSGRERACLREPGEFGSLVYSGPDLPACLSCSLGLLV